MCAGDSPAVVPINLMVTNVVWFTRSANSTVPLIPATSFELSLLFLPVNSFGQYRLEQQEKLN
jgi:hypothetical protein